MYMHWRRNIYAQETKIRIIISKNSNNNNNNINNFDKINLSHYNMAISKIKKIKYISITISTCEEDDVSTIYILCLFKTNIALNWN